MKLSLQYENWNQRKENCLTHQYNLHNLIFDLQFGVVCSRLYKMWRCLQGLMLMLHLEYVVASELCTQWHRHGHNASMGGKAKYLKCWIDTSNIDDLLTIAAGHSVEQLYSGQKYLANNLVFPHNDYLEYDNAIKITTYQIHEKKEIS